MVLRLGVRNYYIKFYSGKFRHVKENSKMKITLQSWLMLKFNGNLKYKEPHNELYGIGVFKLCNSL